jgi:DNA polymerase-3 subunit beta
MGGALGAAKLEKKMQVNILRKHLAAAAVFAAEADVRYYLNGVFAEVRASETRLVASDGNMAGVLRDQVLVGEQDVLPDVIIPNETVKLAITNKSQTVTLAFDDGKWSLAGIAFTPVDGKFPPYRRIIPRQCSGEAAQFNVEFLARFLKAAKALGVKSQPIIRHNGDGGAQVQFYGRDDEFVGVIMPLRAFTEEHPDTGLVQWGADRA